LERKRRGGVGLIDHDVRAAQRSNPMKRAILVSILAAVAMSLALPTTADAQKKGKGKTDTKKVKTYDFTGDDIDGDLIKPDGVTIDTRDFAQHTSLIRIRKDFIREILKSAEDL
jgi:hypothetical protein